MEKQTKQMSKKRCKEFELDLTDYVMGETTFLTKEKQEKLFEHLRQCAKCRDQLWNWKEVISVMKTKTAMDNPEHQEKINKLIQRLHPRN
ncbi:MAG: zf-HC2 domain-containing protein, partial [Planctomycetota bacterium]|nr:zf-HC2 domain-containing protein [Planctomycetota bacterium]